MMRTRIQIKLMKKNCKATMPLPKKAFVVENNNNHDDDNDKHDDGGEKGG